MTQNTTFAVTRVGCSLLRHGVPENINISLLVGGNGRPAIEKLSGMHQSALRLEIFSRGIRPRVADFHMGFPIRIRHFGIPHHMQPPIPSPGSLRAADAAHGDGIAGGVIDARGFGEGFCFGIEGRVEDIAFTGGAGKKKQMKFSSRIHQRLRLHARIGHFKQCDRTGRGRGRAQGQREEEVMEDH